MSTDNDIPIGPNPRPRCGWEYGEHAEGCSLASSGGSPASWCTAEELRHYLKRHHYADEIANELCAQYAKNMQAVFDKGVEVGKQTWTKVMYAARKFREAHISGDSHMEANELCSLLDPEQENAEADLQPPPNNPK